MRDRTIFLTFGPVQEFLSQARRMRDLWAGSYLLSYLAASALHSAERAGGEVVLPVVADSPLYDAVKNGLVPESPGDRVGSIPHVAEVRVERMEPRAVADAARAGWNEAWERVTDAVLVFLRNRGVPLSADAQEIWKRQTRSLWSRAWVLDDPSAMRRRKTLRAFDMPAEPGEKCTNCGSREALRERETSRADVRRFWTDVSGTIDRRDVLQDGRERLCAVCTVKRFYPYVSREALGWSVPTVFPSTVTMASLVWRLRVLEKGADDRHLREAVKGYVEVLDQSNIEKVKVLSDFAALAAAAEAWPEFQDAARAFLEYDGDWLYQEEARSKEHEPELRDQKRGSILGALDNLRRTATGAGIATPSTLYALLVMDGDRMGDLLRDHAAKRKEISRALADFAACVKDVVESQEALGRLIYAGGDDVLAILPAATAIRTADRLSRDYRAAFEQHLPKAFNGTDVRPSISAGIVFAHMHAPLRAVVTTAHRLLDDRAKKEADRDAFAVALWKRPGTVLEFARKWGTSVVEDIEAVRAGIVQDTYSSSFLYGLHHLLEVTSALPQEDELAILTAEYLKSRERVATREEAEERIRLLQRLCQGGRDTVAPVLLARFLEEGKA